MEKQQTERLVEFEFCGWFGFSKDEPKALFVDKNHPSISIGGADNSIAEAKRIEKSLEKNPGCLTNNSRVSFKGGCLKHTKEQLEWRIKELKGKSKEVPPAFQEALGDYETAKRKFIADQSPKASGGFVTQKAKMQL